MTTQIFNEAIIFAFVFIAQFALFERYKGNLGPRSTDRTIIELYSRIGDHTELLVADQLQIIEPKP